MGRVEIRRRAYSRAERLSDAVVHVTGVTAAAVGVPVLLVLAAMWRGDLTALAGVGVYAASLLAMLVCSALYHMLPRPDWRAILWRLDHSAIYLKIAGTYTPFALLSGGHAAGLLAGLWSAALAGIGLRVFAPTRWRWLGFGLYLAMGWAGVLAGRELFAHLDAPVFALIAAGGAIYTLGTAFFLLERLPFHNTIWHGFVLTATALFFAAVVLQLAATAPAGLAADTAAPVADGRS